MTLTAAEVFRNYETDGVPGSGIHQPAKPDIRGWGNWIESLLGGAGAGLGYAMLAALQADLAHADGVLAIVYNDSAANNGTYAKLGASGAGSWSRIGDLPNSVMRLTVTGGTGDAIVATAPETPMVPGSKLFLLTPTAPNTTATMIAVNGNPAVPIKNAFGVDLVSGSLLNGSQVLMAWQVDHYQLLISANVDGSAILAAAVAAQTAAAASAADADADAALLGNAVHQYDSRALAIAATIPTGVQMVRVARYATGYPLAWANFIPGSSAGPMAFQEAGGHWWQLDLTQSPINAAWFGYKGDGIAYDDAALNLFAAQVFALGGKFVIPRGISGTALLANPVIFTAPHPYYNAEIDCWGVTFKTTGAISAIQITAGYDAGGLEIRGANVYQYADANATAGFELYHCANITLSNCKVFAGGGNWTGYACFYLHQSNLADDNTGAQTVTLENCVAWGVSGAFVPNGVNIEGACNFLLMRGGSLVNCTNARRMATSTSGYMANGMVFDGQNVENCTLGLFFVGVLGNSSSRPLGLRIINQRYETVAEALTLGNANQNGQIFMAGNMYLAVTTRIDNANAITTITDLDP